MHEVLGALARGVGRGIANVGKGDILKAGIANLAFGGFGDIKNIDNSDSWEDRLEKGGDLAGNIAGGAIGGAAGSGIASIPLGIAGSIAGGYLGSTVGKYIGKAIDMFSSDNKDSRGKAVKSIKDLIVKKGINPYDILNAQKTDENKDIIKSILYDLKDELPDTSQQQIEDLI